MRDKEEEEEQHAPVKPPIAAFDELLNLRVSKIKTLWLAPIKEWFTGPRESV